MKPLFESLAAQFYENIKSPMRKVQLLSLIGWCSATKVTAAYADLQFLAYVDFQKKLTRFDQIEFDELGSYICNEKRLKQLQSCKLKSK